MEDDMINVEQALCKGDKDFVVGVQSATGQLFTGPSVKYEHEASMSSHPDDLTIAMKAVKQILVKGSFYTNDYSTFIGNKSLQGVIATGMYEYVEAARHRCRDRNLENDNP